MSETNNRKPLLHKDHPKPITRRDFLAQGLIAGGGYVMAPTLLGMIARDARASGCGDTPPETPYIPFLVVDMAGGAALPGNFLVGKNGSPDELLSSYSLLGWNPRTTELDRRFGLPMAGRGQDNNVVSKMLEGMLANMSADAQAKFRMASICHKSQDDTSNNKTSALIEIARAGLQGREIQVGMGTANSDSGANTGVPTPIGAFKPLEIARVENASNAVGFGPMNSVLSPQSVLAIARASSNLSRSQAERFSRLSQGEQLAAVADSGYGRNLCNLSSPVNLDPRRDPIFQQIYTLAEGGPSDSMDARVATIVLNVLNKTCGPGAIVIDGCDYHDGGFATGDGKDREAGVWIGRAVEAAHRMRKPLMIHLLTDGGCYSRENERAWASDDGLKCMSVIGYYNPNAAPELRRTQLGSYVDGQGVDLSTIVSGNDTTRIAQVVLANYLNVCGQISRYETLSAGADGALERGNIDEVLLFG